MRKDGRGAGVHPSGQCMEGSRCFRLSAVVPRTVVCAGIATVNIAMKIMPGTLIIASFPLKADAVRLTPGRSRPNNFSLEHDTLQRPGQFRQRPVLCAEPHMYDGNGGGSIGLSNATKEESARSRRSDQVGLARCKRMRRDRSEYVRSNALKWFFSR